MKKQLDYARREQIRLCMVHQAIHSACLASLGADGFFQLDEIRESIGCHGISTDSIRWDYIREWLEEDVRSPLVPLSKEWFLTERQRKARGLLPPEVAPEKYVSLGHGKATVGFASVTTCDGKLAIRKLDQKDAVAGGTHKAASNYRKVLTDRRLIPPPPENGALPSRVEVEGILDPGWAVIERTPDAV